MVCTHRGKAEPALLGSCLCRMHANSRGLCRNYVYNQKYIAEGGGKYHLIQSSISHAPPSRSILPEGVEFKGLHHHFLHRFSGFMNLGGEAASSEQQPSQSNDGSLIQLTRSCCPWSSGHPTEHSIANAYIHAITNAKHFVYIENQVGSFRYPLCHPTSLRMLMRSS